MQNKILSIFCIFILVSFIFMNTCFASSSFDVNYDYLYEFKIDNEFTYSSNEGSTSVANLEKYVTSNLSDDRVISGDYYYFVFQSYFKGVQNVLIKKSAVNKMVLTHYLIRNDLNTIMYDISVSDSFSSSDAIWLNGKAEYTTTGIHNISFYCDSTNHTLITNFATNYDGDIFYNCSNGDTKTFFQGSPLTLAQALEKAAPVEIWKNLMKNVVVSLIVFLVGFLTFSKAWAWLKTQLSKA